jgi:hypothetical protein
VRLLAVVQATERAVSAEVVHTAVRSAFGFVCAMRAADNLEQCAVPVGAPSLVDTTVGGFSDLAAAFQLYAPDW